MTPPAAAIAPITLLPVFLELEGRAALVAGGSIGAAWKAELLAAAGADTRIFAANPSERMKELVAGRKNVSLIARAWKPGDLNGATVAILDAEDEHEARAFRAAARAAGALVNVIDDTEFCDFSFGSIVNRSPLVIAISTDGAAPVLAQAVRWRLEALLPASLSDWAGVARDWRKRLDHSLETGQRRRFWERFVDLVLGAGARRPGPEDFAALENALEASAAPPVGEITLVGAGPGDPELMTLKAVAALQSADVILYDRVVSPRALELARREAERIDVGRNADIVGMLLRLASQGKRVVRLMGGDPGVFGRANEAILSARAAGVKVSIVPGVTAALAAAAELGLSLADRDLAARVQFVSADVPDISWPALAASDATTAIYMGNRPLGDLVARLVAEGLDPMTPAIYMASVGEDGRRIAGAIAKLPEKVAAEAPEGPALVIYGRALGAEEAR